MLSYAVHVERLADAIMDAVCKETCKPQAPAETGVSVDIRLH